MFFQKLKYKIRTINSKFTALNINWWNIFGRLILLLIIIGLSANIYSTFQKGYTTAERFQVEQEKLELIKKENDELKDQVKEYASIEYKRIYARDNLNLAHPNETIYLIDRPIELPEIEKLPEDTIRIKFEDKAIYWTKLLFGNL